MKVCELLSHAHLLVRQKTVIHDRGETYTSINNYRFDLDSETFDYLLNLKVINFQCSDAGLEINAK